MFVCLVKKVLNVCKWLIILVVSFFFLRENYYFRKIFFFFIDLSKLKWSINDIEYYTLRIYNIILLYEYEPLNDEIWTNWSNGKFSLQIILQILYTWINFTNCIFNCNLLIFAFAKLNTDGSNKKKTYKYRITL